MRSRRDHSMESHCNQEITVGFPCLYIFNFINQRSACALLGSIRNRPRLTLKEVCIIIQANTGSCTPGWGEFPGDRISPGGPGKGGYTPAAGLLPSPRAVPADSVSASKSHCRAASSGRLNKSQLLYTAPVSLEKHGPSRISSDSWLLTELRY